MQFNKIGGKIYLGVKNGFAGMHWITNYWLIGPQIVPEAALLEEEDTLFACMLTDCFVFIYSAPNSLSHPRSN